MTSRILHGDVLSFFKHYRGPQFHAALLDPPYHLTSITKRFGGKDSAPAQYGKDGAFARASRGFMNSTWDGGDIAFRPETWAAMAELLYPGAFIIAFAGSRGWHRQAVAMEDAGLIMHPSIFGWGQGQGFPKATQIGVCRCANRNESGTQKAGQGDYLSSMRNSEVSASVVDQKGDGNDILLSQLSGKSKLSSSQATQQQSEGDSEAGNWPSAGKEPSMEGRSNISSPTWELCVSEIRPMSGRIFVYGAQGWLRHGASLSHGSCDSMGKIQWASSIRFSGSP